MKFFVSGSDGYIGSYLCEKLIGQGHEVIAFDRCFFGKTVPETIEKHSLFTRIKGDIRDLPKGVLEGVDTVVDLAALSNDPSSELNSEWTYQINFLGRTALASRAKDAGVKKYIFASSCSVYGAQEDEKVDETSHCKPVSLYAETCVKTEEFCLGLNSTEFQVTSLRQATLFGLSHRMRFDLMVNLMTLTAFKEKQIFIMGGGQQWRPLVHVADMADAFIHFGSIQNSLHAGKTYNIGIDNHRVVEVAHMLADAIPNEIRTHVVPEDADKRSYQVSFDRLLRETDFKPKHTIIDGALEIYSALKAQTVIDSPKTFTVKWYKSLIEMDAHLEEIKMDGKLFNLS